MKPLMWALRLLLFLLLFGFAVKNDHPVDLFFFFETVWQLPLVFIVLLAFAAGTLMGVTATLASWLRHRREIARLRRELARERERQPAVPVGPETNRQEPA